MDFICESDCASKDKQYVDLHLLHCAGKVFFLQSPEILGVPLFSSEFFDRGAPCSKQWSVRLQYTQTELPMRGQQSLLHGALGNYKGDVGL